MTNTPFKTLIQNEMTRIQSLVATPQPVGMYAIPTYRYTNTRRSATLAKRRPSTYIGLMSFARAIRFFLF